VTKRRTLYSLVTLLVVLVVATIQVNSQYEKLVKSIEFSESLWSDIFVERSEILDYINTWRDPYSESATDYLIEESREVNKKYAKSFAVVRDSIKRISLLPWNRAHRNVKTEYLRHIGVRVSNLEKGGEKLRTLELETTWDQFCSQATKSSPLLAFGRYDMRLAQICAKGID